MSSPRTMVNNPQPAVPGDASLTIKNVTGEVLRNWPGENETPTVALSVRGNGTWFVHRSPILPEYGRYSATHYPNVAPTYTKARRIAAMLVQGLK